MSRSHHLDEEIGPMSKMKLNRNVAHFLILLQYNKTEIHIYLRKTREEIDLNLQNLRDISQQLGIVVWCHCSICACQVTNVEHESGIRKANIHASAKKDGYLQEVPYL